MQPGDVMTKLDLSEAGGHGYRLPQPKWMGELRICWRCKKVDRPIHSGDSDENGPIFDHDVTIDLVFITRDFLSSDELAKGYMYMKVADRHAKVRMSCRDCLDLTEAEEQVWRDFKKQREAGSEDADPSFYAHLCEG
jgi:hypothetical protein